MIHLLHYWLDALTHLLTDAYRAFIIFEIHIELYLDVNKCSYRSLHGSCYDVIYMAIVMLKGLITHHDL